MHKNPSRLWLGFATVALAATMLALFGAGAHRAAAQGTGFMPAISLGHVPMQEISPTTNPSGSVRFTCQLTSPAGCYGPDQIRAAYGIQPLLDAGTDGAGRTIVIVDAFGSPDLGSDLAAFDALWGLPAASLTVDAPFGIGTSSAGNLFGWRAETSLDVEWAHAIAPAAKIELVVARTSSDQDIFDAQKWAIDHNVGDVISQSFGEAEQCMDASLLRATHELFEEATAKGMTLFASSGDSGSSQFTCDGNAFFLATSTPATDPNVTAVGGTRLVADGISGAYGSESVWNEELTFGVGAGEPLAPGGGVSTVFGRPDFQAPVVKDTHMREVPDVAYDAAINGGVIVIISCPAAICGVDVPHAAFRVGGTSAGSPQWAALTALADQLAGHRLGALNKTLYHLGQSGAASTLFHDVADGTNAVVANAAFPGSPIAGFDAAPGWDETTGWGTPNADALVPALAKPGQGQG